MTFQLPTQAGVVRGKKRAHVLGVQLLGARCETDEIGEEDRDYFSLLVRGSSRIDKGAPAFGTVLRAQNMLVTAGTADAHAQSLRLPRLGRQRIGSNHACPTCESACEAALRRPGVGQAGLLDNRLTCWDFDLRLPPVGCEGCEGRRSRRWFGAGLGMGPLR